MKTWQKICGVIVLLMLPLQGMAATFAAFSCLSPDAQHEVAAAAHAHDDASSHGHDGESGHDHSGHLTCHHVFSAITAAAPVTAAPELPAFESSISLLLSLFVPERPQRPPRS